MPNRYSEAAGGRASRIIDRFGEAAKSAGDEGELAELLAATAMELGFDYFALLHHASLANRQPGLARLHNYPQSWEEELAGQMHLPFDPVHQASVRTHVGFKWASLEQLVRLGESQLQLLERARRHDIADGFTVPINVPGEPAGSCTFALRGGRPLPEHRLSCAQQIGLEAFSAARRLCGLPAASNPPRLSRREKQCIRLIAAGKTDWEIAAILGISIETAHQYVKRARAAYDVTSRSQLVACGLRDALVSFEEAIPPSG